MSSSLSTITGIVNMMIGGAMLTFPILFRQAGLGLGLLIAGVSGFIAYKTCELFIIHMSQKEETIEDSIRRILGAKWEMLFKKISSFYLMCVLAIYIDLIVDQFYNVLYFSFKQTGHDDWIADKDVETLVFDKFSVQYLSIIMLLPILRMTFIIDFSLLLKLTSMGFLAIMVYMLFIFYEFFGALGHIDVDKIPLVGKSFGNLLGACAVAFAIHPTVHPIMKANANQKNNLRDLRISFFLGFLIYSTIGIIGSLSVLDKKCKVTIINCYLDSWQALTVEIVYFLMLLTVFPYLVDVGRTRFLQCYYSPLTKSQIRKFNLIFVSISIGLAFLGPYAPLDLIMNLVGSIMSFFIIYVFPIKIHWHCLYKLGKDSNSLLTQQNEDIQCGHEGDRVESWPKWSRLVFYGIFILMGIGIGVYGIYGFFKNLFFQ